MHPIEHTAARSERDKKPKQTPHFCTYSLCAFDLPQTLQDGRARRAHPKTWEPFFDPIHSFSAWGQNEQIPADCHFVTPAGNNGHLRRQP